MSFSRATSFSSGGICTLQSQPTPVDFSAQRLIPASSSSIRGLGRAFLYLSIYLSIYRGDFSTCTPYHGRGEYLVNMVRVDIW